MHCYQPYRKQKVHSKDRMIIWSLLIAVITFCVIYVPVHLWSQTPNRDDHVLILIIGLILLYPLHKFFHILPIIHLWHDMKFSWSTLGKFVPLLTIQVRKPLVKWHYLTSLMFPLLINSLILSSLTFAFPAYSHYFTILQAVHFGICAQDLFILKSIVTCPNASYIEENSIGFEVLVNEAS
ncbi:DUF3267 domain-containing protein [Mangrovibacillus cuniculi]|uniref:DUF3267 domain-containing protein n=1 Tax=Mangrovibacillus cuniculi TaxID=2593652 RepID=A0A7S8C9S0_9BACI|nr:DUF3267 domain-containing protein [Mangrovibacillus cuniculi]QPC45987.1 DUF3267 domain-containing protein [Mangrovibacillus cuniculi]